MEGITAEELAALDPEVQQAIADMKSGDLGRLTLSEVFALYVPRIKDLWKAMQWDEYFVRVQEGDTTAMLVMGLSLVVGGLVAKKFINVIFPADEAPDILKQGQGVVVDDEEEQEIVLRDFTLVQLRVFDGEGDKPIYVALRREVFDVSHAKDFYGKGCSYHCFAGREASRAMAKMSFDEADLANGMKLDDLGPFDRHILDDWYEKFKYYKCYPVVGKVSLPPTGLELTVAELGAFDGKQAVPKDRCDAPIYIAIRGTILDVSYGGKDFYSGESGYAVLAGKEASRALGKMSLSAEDYNSTDISDLTEQQVAALDDWLAKLGKKYPKVGTVVATKKGAVGAGVGAAASAVDDSSQPTDEAAIHPCLPCAASSGAGKGKGKGGKGKGKK
jgi:membrane-associated progesterone receptor component